MNSDETKFRPDGAALSAAVVAVAATYFYFLIYAEFALLEIARTIADDEAWRLRGLMTVLGLAGVLGSLGAAWRFRVDIWQTQLSWSFRACGVAAVLALVAQGWVPLLVAAGCSGLALGWLTVTLATGLRPAIGTGRLGLVVGLGTGLAYAACNLPAVFEAAARSQAIMAALVAGTASISAAFLTPREPSISTTADYGPGGMLRWIVVLALLVGLDSAAFYVIQHVDTLRAGSWDEGRLWLNAAVHLGAAVGAGWWLDRGGRAGLAVAGYGLLAAGWGLIDQGGGGLYAAGVSIYSALLVYFPARGGRAWVAGLVYAVAGWLGSALGIGLAQEFGTVPVGVVLAVGGGVGALLVWRQRAQRVALGGMILLVAAASPEAIAASAEGAVARGQQVYVAEGCIHCHSQFVRPGTVDEVRWGEAAVVTGTPPLFGNRRQGPDLATVGRRLPLAEWHRQHLMNPRAFNPRSRMPRYDHLFAEGDGRGEALVAYLLSLRGGREVR